jgi:GDPmannose 4,6-dehydratase
VKEFLESIFSCLRLDWQEYVETDPYYFRPTEVDFLLGDSSKARNNLNWKPRIGFQELVRMMTEYDLELAEREAHELQFHN